MIIISNLSRQYFIQFFVHINVHLILFYVQLVYCLILLLYFILFRQGQPCCETAKLLVYKPVKTLGLNVK